MHLGLFVMAFTGDRNTQESAKTLNMINTFSSDKHNDTQMRKTALKYQYRK